VFDRGAQQPGARPGLLRLAFPLDPGHVVLLELQPTSVNNPFQIRDLSEFQCPA
jgi:hypothetical protein